MPILEHVDPAYFEKLQSALIEAVMKASLDEEKKVAAVYSGELVTACINLIATFAHTSKGVSSPTKLRLFGDECGKRIRQRIVELQKGDHSDVFSTVHADELQ